MAVSVTTCRWLQLVLGRVQWLSRWTTPDCSCLMAVNGKNTPVGAHPGMPIFVMYKMHGHVVAPHVMICSLLTKTKCSWEPTKRCGSPTE